MNGLTPRQRSMLNYIKQYIRDNRASPSYDEMREALGLRSKSGIHRMVHALIERGHISMAPDRKRSISIIGSVDIDPVTAIEFVLDTYSLSADTADELAFLVEYEKRKAANAASKHKADLTKGGSE